jgi:hypothetical protein
MRLHQMGWRRRVLAFANSNGVRPDRPGLSFYPSNRLFLKVQNQRNPKGKRPFGFQIVPYDINCEIVLAEAVFNFELCIVIDCHVGPLSGGDAPFGETTRDFVHQFTGYIVVFDLCVPIHKTVALFVALLVVHVNALC